MAGIASLAAEDWQQIYSRFTPAGDGYDVSLWNGSSWESKHVSLDLDRGFDMAQLSGDVDAQGRAEIWPILLEKAYASLAGGYDEIDRGGWSGDLYTALTGTPRNDPIGTAGKTNDDMWIEINNARGVGKQVILGSKDEQPAGSPLEGDHAYVILDRRVRDTDGDGHGDVFEYLLYNPWGFDNLNGSNPFWISKDLLSSTIAPTKSLRT